VRARIKLWALRASAVCFGLLTYEWHKTAHYQWLLPLGLLLGVVSVLR
jgi:hypothetical protein